MRDLRFPASDGPVDRAAFCLLIREISSGERAMGELPCSGCGTKGFSSGRLAFAMFRVEARHLYNPEKHGRLSP
jgi:hypothetical protein